MNALFLFGAGASTGSESEKVKQPPLGSDLLPQLRIVFPQTWGNIQSTDSEDFEQIMSQLMRSDPNRAAQLKREMAKYFFRFEPSLESLYIKLATRLALVLNRVSFITLNYERLLELALFKSGFLPVCGLNPSPESKEIELCFPHGCCHFWVDEIKGPLGSFTFPMSDGIVNGPVKVYGNPHDFFRQIKENPLLPVMSFFEPNKTTPVGNDFIDQQRGRCKELIESAGLIVIIGVRVREYDAHLWDPLKKASGKLIYCSGSQGGNEFDQWRKKNRPHGNHDEVLRGRFQESLEEISEKVSSYIPGVYSLASH
jgi:hypothetical protein